MIKVGAFKMNSTYPWAVLTNTFCWFLLDEDRKGKKKVLSVESVTF